ncbi:PREDICTED: uncharacterized protein K02A2.6-like [Cyphomyrmex costatus]|uniref:uncharacterized protein K02A2.6-like n=1 Tax=Cyphomyrmex costatus TaxID=456900 RepID=UPI00085231B4|nr:PREDICTED: uncharacterized protein K02A2.6-like [Cyphomyrmex costatus]
MDAKQFQELMKVLTTCLERQTIQQVTQPSVNSNNNLVSHFGSFDPDKESFEHYKQRLENFLRLKNIFDDKNLCAKVLLNCIGSKYYELLTSLTAPNLPTERTYEQLMELLETYLCPKPNVVVQQHRFLSCVQKPENNIAAYVAELRKFIITCGFNCECGRSVADLFLRAQFIRGLRDTTIREKLLQTTDLTFKKAVDTALALEASKLDNHEISGTPAGRKSSIENVNRISKSRDKSSKRSNNRNNPGKSRSNSQARSKSRINYRALGLENVCIRCGRNNHKTQDCRINFNNLKCHACDKTGHVKKVCISTLMKPKNSDTLTLETDTQEDNKKLNDTNSIQDFYGINEVIVDIYEKSSVEGIMFIVESGTPLFGRTWIRHLRINLLDLDKTHIPESMCSESINCLNTHKDDVIKILQQFNDIFEPEVGCIPNFTCSLKLREEAKPVFLKARDVPFALRDKVDTELDTLEAQGIISKIDCVDWGSPLVVIPKPDGSVRLCVDYKIAVNPQLKGAHYPIPRIDEILNSLRNAKFFCTLDLFKAYLHVAVDEESKIIQTISTHRGTYKMNRLSFGIKTAPSEFHRILDQILSDLDGITTYFDDIVVSGSTYIECKQRLIACLERLKKYNLHLNQKKCRFFEKKISYLGYIIEENTISKCPNKVKAILEAPKPKNTEDVKIFLGLITYYSRFIPNVSTITYPIRQLLQKEKNFSWSSSCEAAFIKLKEEIASDRVLMPYNPSLPVTVACDASPTGIAGVLSHIVEGIEKPVAFVSRSLTRAEQNYSQLDREALAIIFAIQKFYRYVYGRPFTLISDNRPLTRIFQHNTKLPAITSARLLRYATFLSNFNYKVEHRKAEDHGNVDYLSRASLEIKSTAQDEDEEINDQIINQISTTVITSKTIAEETIKDEELSQLKENLASGETYDPIYSLHNGIIFRGHRIFIPTSLRPEILKELHYTHLGISKMKKLARRYCYWRNIDKDIEGIVRSCLECTKGQNNPRKAPLHHWEEPESNFQRVHIDYAGPFQGHQFLVLVDAKSKWPEVRITKGTPTSVSTIRFLENIFSSHGTPEVLVSDNATIFKSEEFTQFCQRNGIFQKFIAPGHPATNGLAERYVQILKKKLKAMESDPSTMTSKVENILYRFRATPLHCGKSPSEIYLNRQIRTSLDLLRPPSIRSTSTQECHVSQLSVGDRVQSRAYSGTQRWKLGVVTKKLGRLHYLIHLDEGYLIKRHINQLRQSEVPKEKPERKSVHFGPVTRNWYPLLDNIPEPQPRTEEQPLQVQAPEKDPVPAAQNIQTPIGESAIRESQNQDPPLRRSERIRKPPTYLDSFVPK